MRGTLDISWYCGFVATFIIGCGLLLCLLVVAVCGCLQLLRSWTCLSSCRTENSCVEAPEKPDKLRVESHLVNSLDQFCAQLSRS